MRTVPSGVLALGLLLLPRIGASQPVLDQNLAKYEPSHLSVSFMDPQIRNRTHLTTRSLIRTAVPGADWDMNWNVEIRATGQVTEHFGLSGVIPFGFQIPQGQDAIPYFGNIRLGGEFGWTFDFEDLTLADDRPVTQLGLGFAFDIYAPTSTSECGPIQSLCTGLALAQLFNPFEPELYVQQTMLFRNRAHVDFRFDRLKAEFEFGISPGFTVREPIQETVLATVAGRISVIPIQWLELYSKLGSAFRLTGPFVGDSPAVLTAAARFHIVSASFDPAIFTSVDLDMGNVIVGIDLAGVIRNRPGRRSNRERARDSFDF